MDTPYYGKTQFSLVVRLALLVYLISHGHSQWMLNSGAWWRILTNHRSLLKDDEGRYTAGEYVSKCSLGGFHSPSFFDHDRVMQWTMEEEDRP